MTRQGRAKSKTKPAARGPTTKDKPVAADKLLLGAHAQAGAGLLAWSSFGEPDIIELVRGLRERSDAIKGGDLSHVEAMLLGQAEVLQSMFVVLARKAARQDYLPQYQTFATLALKAQAQCRATLTALADIKLPRPLAFVGQANIAHGPQQVNVGNGTPPASPARGGNPVTEQSKLLGVDHERMDARAAIPAGAGDPVLATVDAQHGAAHRRR